MKETIRWIYFMQDRLFFKITCNEGRLYILYKKIRMGRRADRLSNIVMHSKKAGIWREMDLYTDLSTLSTRF